MSSPEVANPVAVRYGWADCPIVNLFGKDGLPASPFRTDDWPMITSAEGGKVGVTWFWDSGITRWLRWYSWRFRWEGQCAHRNGTLSRTPGSRLMHSGGSCRATMKSAGRGRVSWSASSTSPGTGSTSTGGPYDITKLTAGNPAEPKWGPDQAFHHWGEPELGYYVGGDDYVIRKHAYMLMNAGIDVIFFDVTNAFTYDPVYLKLCSVYRRAQRQGLRHASDIVRGALISRKTPWRGSTRTSTSQASTPSSGSTGRASR